MRNISKYLLTFLRIVVGWHLMYEGISKLITPGWSSKIFLMESKWIFADIFHKMAASPEVMKVVDFMNIWGLILIGLSLFIGLFVRWSSVFGAILMLFYFMAFPPIPGYTFGTVAEGNYLWVNKTFIELFILLVFTVLPANMFYGADRWIKQWREEKAEAPIPNIKKEDVSVAEKRREFLRDMISVPFLGAFAYAVYKKKKWDSFEEKFITRKPDSVSGATLKSFNFASLDDLKGQIPKVKIGDLEISRLVMGGNLIGGWAHARDLLYTSKLVKAYHTDERIMQTMQLSEKCGINALITNPRLIRIINKYWHETGGKMQFISDCGHKEGFLKGIRDSEAGGASAMYCQGSIADRLTYAGKFDEIIEGLELIRSYGKPAGIGAHRIETIQACVERGIKPDFWVKTLHHHNYWSAQVDPEKKSTVEPGFKDNIFCFKPDETIEYMNSLDEPWIAFKILAAGAISPKNGFKYAFENGADLVCVGMYDFQIVEDANLTLDVLADANLKNRKRRWMT